MISIQLFIRASGSILTDQEIIDAIPASTMARIKAKDPHPYFRAFVVAHEGVADPFVETKSGFVKKVVRVLRSTIESMARRMPGAKFFDDYHKKGNRVQIGTEVAFLQKDIDGNLHDIAIAYADPSQRQKLSEKDIVSMEADVSVDEHSDGSLVLSVIKQIKAYATGKSSDGGLPAWSGARSVGALYAFSETNTQEHNTMSADGISSGSSFTGQNGVRLPYPVTPDGFPDPVSTSYSHAENIVKSFLRAKTVRPSQILTWDAIFGKREKGPGGETLWTGGDQEFRNRIFEHEKSIVEPYQKQIDDLKKYRDEAVSYRTKDFRQELIKSAREEAGKHKFDEKLTNIVMKRLEKVALSVDPAVMLLDEKERGPKLETMKADVIKSTIEDVRSEWQAANPQSSGGTGRQTTSSDIGDSAGDSDDGGDW